VPPKTPGIFLRGMLMGAADIVPGVSGGTMAFITGIYDELLDSIRSVDLACLRLVFQGEIRAAWTHINGNFLLALGLGILTSILSLARLLGWVLENHPVPLWAFFFGLIFASALMLLRQVGHFSPARVVLLLGGIAIAGSIALLPVLDLQAGPGGVFFAGFLAICAMILPGISGSFILVLLGMYAPVLAAVNDLDMTFLLVLALGAVTGLLCFSRLLFLLLRRFHAGTMSVLTGFLFGSLAIVWPWKYTLSWVRDSGGELKAAQQVPVMPIDFQLATGQDPQVYLCLAVMAAGFLIVGLVDGYWGDA